MKRPALALLVAGLLPIVPVAAAADERVLVSRQSPALGGAPSDFGGTDPTLSRDGRLVAFVSSSRNLSDADTEPEFSSHTGNPDVFVHDRQTGETTLVSPGPESYEGMIAAGGRHVVFVTAAGPHEPGTVHVRDLRTGALEVVGGDSTTTGYAYPQAPPAISGDGRIVVHETGDRLVLRAFDRKTRRATVFARLSRGRFSGLSLSTDGRFAAYTRLRRPPKGGDDVTVHRRDLRTGADRVLARYSIQCCHIGLGIFGTALSDSGRHIAYVAGRTRSSGLYYPRVHVRDMSTGRTRDLGAGADPSISGDGRWVVFTYRKGEDDWRVMLHDTRKRKTRTLLKQATRGRLSADGRWLGFVGSADDPAQVFAIPR